MKQKSRPSGRDILIRMTVPAMPPLRAQCCPARRRPKGDYAAPVAVEKSFADAHHGAGEAEAEHGEAHHQRAEMRPAADREDKHDADLQRDHRAGLQPDGEIQRPGSVSARA